MKLVRDLIPDIVRDSGSSARFRVATPLDKRSLLLAKVVEEALELQENPCVEELGDILDVLDAVRRELGIEVEELVDARAKKTAARGGFELGIVMVSPVEATEPPA